MAQKKISLISLLLLFFLLLGCRSKKYEERIAQLEAELEQSDGLLGKSDSTMQLISVMLDSIAENEAIIAFNMEKTTLQNSDSILQKIEKARDYITFSKTEIERLEDNLATQVARSEKANRRINGLLSTIRRLKKDLSIKEDSLSALNSRVLNLEEDKAQLASELGKQKSKVLLQAQELLAQKEALEQQEKAMAQRQAALEMEEEAKRFEEAEKLYALGRQDEILGDKTFLAAKKKKRYYLNAEAYYQQSYELGKPEAKEAMYEVKKKALKVKFAKKVN